MFKKMRPLMIYILKAGSSFLACTLTWTCGAMKNGHSPGNVLRISASGEMDWQEFAARRFHLKWITVTGHQVGTHVSISKVFCNITL